jgi:hypothetical protein
LDSNGRLAFVSSLDRYDVPDLGIRRPKTPQAPHRRRTRRSELRAIPADESELMDQS